MASAQQPVTVPRQAGVRTQLSRLSPLLASGLYYVGITTLGVLWVTIWSLFAYSTVQVEGLLPGIILGVYSVGPVLVIGYRAIRRRTN